jgi:hypothetical protein
MEISRNNDTTNCQNTTKTEGLLKYCDKYPATTRLVDKYSTGIKAITGVAFLAHYFSIQKVSDAHPEAAETTHTQHKRPSGIRRAGIAGLGWSFVWIGILTTTTLAQEWVHRHQDPIHHARKERTPWKLEHNHSGTEELVSRP